MAIPPEVEARLGPAKDLEGLSDADLKAVLKEYYDRCAFSTTKITSDIKFDASLWPQCNWKWKIETQSGINQEYFFLIRFHTLMEVFKVIIWKWEKKHMYDILKHFLKKS